MNSFKGTLRLFKLFVRLDRIRLPLWIVANTGIIALTLPQLQSAYGTEVQQIAYAKATAASAVTRLLGGGLTGPSLGEITIVETFALAAILIGLMNIFLIVRHTRANEESGRSEVLSSLVLGRQAGLSAALLLALCANAITAVLLFVAYIENGLPLQGSLAYSSGLFATGICFALVAAVTSQLFENTRSASGLAGLLLGIVFLVRGIGDVLGTIKPGGLGIETSWITWLSPLGWVTNMRPFSSERWWVLGLFAVLAILLLAVAYYLLAKRDVGLGLFPAKSGRPHALESLLKPFGLILRLNRNTTIYWAVSLIAVGATLGAVANEFSDLIAGNEDMQRMLASIGSGSNVSDLMFSATFTIVGIATSGYALSLLSRMKQEESSGRLEAILATASSRTTWLLKYTLYAGVTSLVILLLTGAAAGLLHGITTRDISQIWSLASSILVHLPSVMVLFSAGILLFGILKNLSTQIAWALLASCLLVFQLGAILGLPQVVMNLSPFTHTPPAPAETITLQPLILLSLVAAVFLVLGLTLFRRRDLSTD